MNVKGVEDLARWTYDILKRHQRVAIVGGPGSGKTTLAKSVSDRKVIHTDDFSELGWSEASEEIATKCNDLRMFLVEGVAVPRALRKGMVVDAVIYLTSQHKPLTKGQAAMGKAVATVFREWLNRPESALMPLHIW